MSAAEQVCPEPYYTPQTVERLLCELPTLLDHHAPRERDMLRPGKHNQPEPPHIRFEERMAKRADVEWALFELPLFQYRVVYLSFVGGFQPQEIADILSCDLESPISPETVRLSRIEGVRLMAWYLGWRDPESGWDDNRKPRRTRVALLSRWLLVERLSRFPAVGRIAARWEALREDP